MRTETYGDVLRVTGLAELSAPSSTAIQYTISSALQAEHRDVEIDSRELKFVDCAGLRTLVALHRSLRSRQGAVRLVSPSVSFLRILEYTQLHHHFQIVNN